MKRQPAKKKGNGDPLLTIVATVALLAVCLASVWAWYFGPCEIYTFAKAGEVPARCLMR